MKKEIDVVAIFKESFSIFAKNPIIILPIVIPFIIQAILMLFIAGGAMAGGAFMSYKMMGGEAPSMGMGLLGSLFALTFIISALIFLLTLFSEGMVIGMAKEALETGQTNINTGLDVAKKRFVDILLASILIGILVGIGFILLVLPGVVIMFFLMLAIPSVVAGENSAVDSMKESYAIVKENVSSAFLLFLGIIVIGAGAVIVSSLLHFIPILGQIAGIAIMGALMGYIGIVFVNYYMKVNEPAVSPEPFYEGKAHCKKCGAPLDKDTKFCERCGMPVS